MQVLNVSKQQTESRVLAWDVGGDYPEVIAGARAGERILRGGGDTGDRGVTGGVSRSSSWLFRLASARGSSVFRSVPLHQRREPLPGSYRAAPKSGLYLATGSTSVTVPAQASVPPGLSTHTQQPLHTHHYGIIDWGRGTSPPLEMITSASHTKHYSLSLCQAGVRSAPVVLWLFFAMYLTHFCRVWQLTSTHVGSLWLSLTHASESSRSV